MGDREEKRVRGVKDSRGQGERQRAEIRIREPEDKEQTKKTGFSSQKSVDKQINQTNQINEKNYTNINGR